MLRLIYSEKYFYAIVATIVIFLSLMSFGINQLAIIIYFINFFLASSYTCVFLFKKQKEEYFYAAVIVCAVLAIGLYIFFVFFEKDSLSLKIYLMPVFFVVNFTASLYFLFRKKIFSK
jgi:hypothetical protein